MDAGGVGPTQFMASVSRFETDGFRENSHAEITQANFVVRRDLGADTELRGVFNLYDSPFAESASFLNEEDARDPVRRRMARGVARARNWGEGANQGQGGVTLEHRFSDTQLFRVTGWGMWRDLDAVGAFRNVNLRRNGRGLRSELQSSAGASAGAAGVDWAAGVDVASQNDDRREFSQVAPRGERRARDERRPADRPDRGRAVGRPVRPDRRLAERSGAVHGRRALGLLQLSGPATGSSTTATSPATARWTRSAPRSA